LNTGLIFDIKKYSIHDGPGIRTTVFFKGCPLSCWWCHNPESQARAVEMMVRDKRCIGCGACVETCPQQAITLNGHGAPVTNWEKCDACGDCAAVCYAEARQQVGRQMSVAEVLADIERDRAFYDESGGGVTFSGGEPLLQPDFLLALLRACRERDIHTALDTCGHARWPALDRVRPYVNLFLYDLKLMDEAKHRQVTGVSNRLILDNLQRLSQAGHAITVRIPVIPGVNDDDDSLRQIAAFLAGLPHLQGVELLPYHRIALDKYVRLNKAYLLDDTQPPPVERMAEIGQMMAGFGLILKSPQTA
jgi:pyruvate formate lyase activating enzyme